MAMVDPRTARRLTPIVTLAGLGIAAVTLGLGNTSAAADHGAANSVARQDVLQAARQEAVNLTTISYHTALRDVDRILSGSTGALRQQFTEERSHFPSVLTADKSVSQGTVLSSALASLTDAKAQVLVAVDASVSTTQGTAAKPTSVLKHYRMVMQLKPVHGRWLVSDVAFAGLPQ